MKAVFSSRHATNSPLNNAISCCVAGFSFLNQVITPSTACPVRHNTRVIASPAQRMPLMIFVMTASIFGQLSSICLRKLSILPARPPARLEPILSFACPSVIVRLRMEVMKILDCLAADSALKPIRFAVNAYSELSCPIPLRIAISVFSSMPSICAYCFAR